MSHVKVHEPNLWTLTYSSNQIQLNSQSFIQQKPERITAFRQALCSTLADQGWGRLPWALISFIVSTVVRSWWGHHINEHHLPSLLCPSVSTGGPLLWANKGPEPGRTLFCEQVQRKKSVHHPFLLAVLSPPKQSFSCENYHNCT